MAPHVGLQYAPTAQIALVQSLTPLLTAALVVVLLHEHLRPWQWAGLVLGVIGVGLVVGQAAVQSPIRFEGLRSEEHTSELQSLMRISYAVFCWTKTKRH